MIYIFGGSGMLGGYLRVYLPMAKVVTRSELDLCSGPDVIRKWLERVQPGDVVINAAGVIPQRATASTLEMIQVNAVFPRLLGEMCAERWHAIHISTDCVFSGNQGMYSEYDTADATDIYGRSKWLGEHPALTTIRTSLIGEERQHKRSLLEWVRSQTGKRVYGYLNHFWNGVTCYELCKQLGGIMQRGDFWQGVRHMHSPQIVSKYALIKQIAQVYALDVDVFPAGDSSCDRSLRTLHHNPVTTDIYDQLVEQRNASSLLCHLSD